MRRRGVGLDEVLTDGVLLVAGDRAVGHRRFERRRLVEQLVREHDAREADDVHGIADPRVAVTQADGGIDALADAQQRQITTEVGHRLAVGVEAGRRAELHDLRRQADAARQQHREQRARRHLRRGHRARRGLATDRVFDVGTLTAHEALRSEDGIDAGLIDRHLLQLVDDPQGQPVRGIDDVTVGDQIPAAIDEPSRARLDKG